MTEKNQLYKFINDFADGGAIRHLVDMGLSVSEITDRLDYPLPKAVVAQKVWDYYIETGKIILEKPNSAGQYVEKISYEKVPGKYGRTSIIQKKTRVSVADRKYVECDFGIQIKKDKEAFINKISRLTDNDKAYILDLPWPRARVYHEADERMERIYLYMKNVNA